MRGFVDREAHSLPLFATNLQAPASAEMRIQSYGGSEPNLWILRSAPRYSSSCESRRPAVTFNSPYTAPPPISATTTPSPVPTICDMRLTPPKPPRASLPKMPAATPPHTPQRPCSGHTPNTSPMRHLFCVSMKAKTNIPPATAPVMSAPTGCMRSEPAQIATRPASGPLCTKPGSLRPTNRAASTPPTIAISELIATRPFTAATLCADITLNPNQPTVSIHAPSARKGMLDGGCAAILPSFANRPCRAPNNTTAPHARQPPTACTTTEPAKS